MLGKPQAPAVNLDAMVAESMKDIPSDDESVDENDPELLVSYWFLQLQSAIKKMHFYLCVTCLIVFVVL